MSNFERVPKSGDLHLSRRQLLRLGGATAALTLAGCTLPSPPSPILSTPMPAQQGQQGASPSLDLDVQLTASPGQAGILPGAETPVWQYQGQMINGDSTQLQALPDSYLGPLFRVRRGQNVGVTFINDTDEESIVHWHGLHVPPEADGHPKYVVGPGERYRYQFTVPNRAGTYWYHPHPHRLTGPQVYRGLAGLFIVHDEEEAAFGLPTGEQDVPLVLQDRTFDRENRLVYLPNGQMDRMNGMLGDLILVNGQPDFALDVAAQPYRLRLLNGSNARIYKLAWSDDTPMTVIGSDGGLLEAPHQKPYVTLAPGERVELWADFSRYEVGASLQLRSLAFDAGGMGMMGGMMGGGTYLPNGAPFPILTVNVARAGETGATLPAQFATIERYQEQSAANAGNPTVYELAMQQMTWTLNGRTFAMTDVADNEIVDLGSLQIWEFANLGGMMGGMGRGGMGMGMSMPHPVHVHNTQFQVLERIIDPAFQSQWQSLADGFVDTGWKDTVLVSPGERVRVALRFEDFTGLY
ncbi:MAG: multicopper oxidase domain-containing protein, partial [Caldilineaceae bacterium]|nr:multicopper oxidase domain-containing protein [Caldilineaceae bacterium]